MLERREALGCLVQCQGGFGVCAEVHQRPAQPGSSAGRVPGQPVRLQPRNRVAVRLQGLVEQPAAGEGLGLLGLDPGRLSG